MSHTYQLSLIHFDCYIVLTHIMSLTRIIVPQLLHKDPSKRPTARQTLTHPLFRERPQMRCCCICMEDLPLASGLECQQGGHFTCSACLAQHALAFSQSDVRTLQKAQAKVSSVRAGVCMRGLFVCSIWCSTTLCCFVLF